MWYKKFCILWIGLTIFLSLVIGLLQVVIDPYFHYHKPLCSLYYSLYNQRYQNDGILRHFDYNAIITGTSMVGNFKSSEVDKIFNVTSVKVPYSGGSYKEINDALATSFRNGKRIKCIIRSLDGGVIIRDKDAMRYDLGKYPFYLYDNNYLNDFPYLSSMGLTKKVLQWTIERKRGGITSFDNYSNWMKHYKFGKKYVLGKKKKLNLPKKSKKLSGKDIKIIKENIEQNVLSLARQQPQTTFYYFFPPYSIAWWASQFESGNLERYLGAEKIAVEMITTCDNIKLFSFYQMHDIVENFDNYKDSIHYGERINSKMLRYMVNGEGLITKQNKDDYFEKQKEYYTKYDYSKIFE